MEKINYKNMFPQMCNLRHTKIKFVTLKPTYRWPWPIHIMFIIKYTSYLYWIYKLPILHNTHTICCIITLCFVGKIIKMLRKYGNKNFDVPRKFWKENYVLCEEKTCYLKYNKYNARVFVHLLA